MKKLNEMNCNATWLRCSQLAGGKLHERKKGRERMFKKEAAGIDGTTHFPAEY